jgi:hypothetical protein
LHPFRNLKPWFVFFPPKRTQAVNRHGPEPHLRDRQENESAILLGQAACQIRGSEDRGKSVRFKDFPAQEDSAQPFSPASLGNNAPNSQMSPAIFARAYCAMEGLSGAGFSLRVLVVPQSPMLRPNPAG